MQAEKERQQKILDDISEANAVAFSGSDPETLYPQGIKVVATDHHFAKIAGKEVPKTEPKLMIFNSKTKTIEGL